MRPIQARMKADTSTLRGACTRKRRLQRPRTTPKGASAGPKTCTPSDTGAARAIARQASSSWDGSGPDTISAANRPKGGRPRISRMLRSAASAIAANKLAFGNPLNLLGLHVELDVLDDSLELESVDGEVRLLLRFSRVSGLALSDCLCSVAVRYMG